MFRLVMFDSYVQVAVVSKFGPGILMSECMLELGLPMSMLFHATHDLAVFLFSASLSVYDSSSTIVKSK